MKEIKSESKFIWKFIVHVLLTPFTLILVLIRKKKFSDLFKPFRELFEFIFEPKFTIGMIIINIIIFVISVFFLSEKTINLLISYPSDILGARIYTLITSGFLHANLVHLLGNMLALFIFGRVVEKAFGSAKTALIYFGALIISGVFSSVINLLLGVDAGGLGASGAIMGLISTAILINPFYITYELILPLPIMIVGWLTIYADISGILNPAADGIGHFAHLGGFISIALIMFFVEASERTKLKKGLMINLVSLLIGAAIYFIVI